MSNVVNIPLSQFIHFIYCLVTQPRRIYKFVYTILLYFYTKIRTAVTVPLISSAKFDIAEVGSVLAQSIYELFFSSFNYSIPCFGCGVEISLD